MINAEAVETIDKKRDVMKAKEVTQKESQDQEIEDLKCHQEEMKREGVTDTIIGMKLIEREVRAEVVVEMIDRETSTIEIDIGEVRRKLRRDVDSLE